MNVQHEIERQSPRKVADRILTIRIEPDNHAIVVNVSDDGLAFHAYSPVRQTGVLHFSFTDNGQRFEGSGELVWTDATQKSGGLRFSSLSRESRQRIWNWLDQLGPVGVVPPPTQPVTKQSRATNPGVTEATPAGAPAQVRPAEAAAAILQASEPSAPAVAASLSESVPTRQRIKEAVNLQQKDMQISPPIQDVPREPVVTTEQPIRRSEPIASSERSVQSEAQQKYSAPRLGLGIPHNYEPVAPDAPSPTPLTQPVRHAKFSLINEDPEVLENLWNQRTDTPPSSRFFSGFVTGGIVSAIVLAIVFFTVAEPHSFQQIKQQVANAIYGAPQRSVTAGPTSETSAPPAALSAVTAPPITPPAPSAPANVETPNTPSASSAPSPSTEVTGKSSEPNSGNVPEIRRKQIARNQERSSASRREVTHVRNTRPPASAGDAGDEDLAVAQRYLNDRTGRVDGATAAPFLWAAVEKGNVTAEVTLADLYAHGQGVPKNCDQARVLLRAAAEKGNSEASQELSQIIRTGCR